VPQLQSSRPLAELHTSSPPAIPATALPRLEVPPNDRFLSYSPIIAGRTVLIELYAPNTDDRDVRERAWRERGGEATKELGHAAQMLERTGMNWRQARNHQEILDAFAAIPKASIS
jgi:hypothetical protein